MRILPSAAGADHAVVERLTDLVNAVYAEAEKGLWQDGAARTTPVEVAGLISAGEIAVAERAGTVVGCARVRLLDASTGEFGLLAADPVHRGTGVGRDLVAFAEQRCREAGATEMGLELLVPRGWTHPSKEFLHGWYTRIGYRQTSTGAIDATYPALAPLLATPCDFRIYRKPLSA